MKRFLGVFLCALLLGLTLQVHEEKEPQEVIETITYLTDEDLSKLYTLRDDVRKPDEIEITYEDAQLLMKLAKAEAGSSAESQANAMDAILNRVNSEEFPDSVREVIYQKNPVQFTTAVNGSLDKAVPDVNSHLALYLIESGQIDHDALFFEASWLEDSWQSKNREFLFEFEGTRYYK